MTIQRTLLPVVFATVLAVLDPGPVLGQSDATCIAYMEADAVYSEAFAAALEGAQEAGSQAYTDVMLPHQIKYMAAYSAANEAGFEAAKQTGRRCGGFVLETEEAAMRLACQAQEAAYRATLEAYDVDDKAVEERARKAQAKAAEDFKAAAVEDAGEQRDRAYRAAYEGPTSTVASVMKKLIKADRRRCRQRLER